MFNNTKKFWKCREKCLKYSKSRNIYYIILYYIILYKCKLINRKMNSGIPVNENIKKFTAPHGLSGIYISKNAIINEDCTIFQQCTIGSNTLKDSKRYGAPTIGKNVYIGAGAKIIGNIKIGDNVRIGANCVVVDNIPDNCTVVMEKPRIIIRDLKRNDEFNI